MNEEQVRDFEKRLDNLKREIVLASSKLQELHHSSRRAGSAQGYTKSFNKLQYLIKILEDAKKDYHKASEEHLELLRQNKDSGKNQIYNYININLNKLPVRKK